MKQLIAKVALPVPLDRLFDYLIPESLGTPLPGVRVSVPFGRSQRTGILLEICQQSNLQSERLKPLDNILDQTPLLTAADKRLLSWAAHYYHHAIGEVFALALPRLLRQGRALPATAATYYVLSAKGKELDARQIKHAPKQQSLLHYFKSLDRPLDSDLLSAWDARWSPTLKALLQKEFVQRDEQPTDDFSIASVAPSLTANPDQRLAIDSISAQLDAFGAFLVQGVTGSGKTEVYMQVIEQVIAQHRQVLVLLPEISLTPQLESRFRQRFSVEIVTFHSRLTERQRLHAWTKMQQGNAAIMLGTRSALFTPAPRLGIIILDEEHDGSFKQQEGLRYSARDVAVVRARQLQIPIVMGSATPSLESLHNARSKRYQLLQLPQRAGNAVQPRFEFLDIRNQPLQHGLSEKLIAIIRAALSAGEQTLLFINRRGYAPVLICHSCGYVGRCLRCDANLVVHFQDQRLRCHHCGSEQPLPNRCPSCDQVSLQPLGAGTERVEDAIAQLFPEARCVRLDSDTTQRKGTMEALLATINERRADIILGTQMLAKGHHFPGVTLVALLDVDSGLFSIDFRATEKLAQLIVQVAGRAGRDEKPGRVILQTRHPDHHVLQTLRHHGYEAFAEDALRERQAARLPPYCFQCLLRAQATRADHPQHFLAAVTEFGRLLNDTRVQLRGPVPAPMAKRAGKFHYQLLLQSEDRKALHQFLDRLLAQFESIPLAKKVRWSLDIDPIDLY